MRTPEDFIALNRLFIRKPGGAPRIHPTKAAVFLLSHREALRAMIAARLIKPVPSYANCRYNAIHVKWFDDDGKPNYVRYSWVPEEGGAAISRRKGKRLERDYLQRDL